MPTKPPHSPLAQIEAKVAAVAQRNPAVAKALREERAALLVASAVAELLEFRDLLLPDLAKKSGIALPELERIVAGSTEGTTSVAVLATIAASLDYRFGFGFVPKELSLEQSTSYVTGIQQSVATAVSGVQVPDYREVL